MRTAPTFARAAEAPRWTRFVLVNHRVPRNGAYCAMCCEPIETGYVREPQTRLLYCDAECFAGHQRTTMLALEHKARRAS